MLHIQTSGEGKIVAFRRPPASLRPSSLPPEAERGTVLFFTGIRYERREEAPCFDPAMPLSDLPASPGREGH